MRTTRRGLLVGAVLALSAGAVGHASDRVAVYGRVDRVALEPIGKTPETIQVWGVFSIAVPDNPNDYRPAASGYLYFAMPSDAAARREWNDLETVAGTGQIVAFGSRWDSIPRLRQASEKPASPDRYTVNFGVVKVQGRTDYAPIRDIGTFKRTSTPK